MHDPKDILENSEALKPYINNEFLIIPFDKISCINVNEEKSEETIRLHIDILKIGG